MWQRVQTLYLLISFVLTGIMLFAVKAVVPGASGEPVEAYKYSAYVPYLILMIIIELLTFLALTTYKFRVFQMRTAVLAALITLAFQIWLVVDFISNRGTGLVYKVSAVFPLVCVILDLLAARGILADEMLVESAYHLRKSRRERENERKAEERRHRSRPY
jgi:hypothetical protein